MSKILIETVNLNKTYKHLNGNITLFNNLNLKVKKGDLVALVGPSGSGKSSLLHLLALLDEPTKGDIKINDVFTKKFLDEKKILDILSSIEKIIKLKDPTNIILDQWKRPNGLKISKVSIPIGVVAVIYESRPNVTSDVASLCFKSGNPVILKGGSESIYSNYIISKLFRKALKKNN